MAMYRKSTQLRGVVKYILRYFKCLQICPSFISEVEKSIFKIQIMYFFFRQNYYMKCMRLDSVLLFTRTLTKITGVTAKTRPEMRTFNFLQSMRVGSSNIF